MNIAMMNLKSLGSLESIIKTGSQYLLQYETGEKAFIEILNDHVFRYYMSPTGTFLPFPKPNNSTDKGRIVSKTHYNKEYFDTMLTHDDFFYHIFTGKITISFDKIKGTMNVYDRESNKVVFGESETICYGEYESIQTLKQGENEFFFGGGMQNGRFTHKHEQIDIVNTNNWEDGGVTSPCPFYWSSYGYGVLRHTWQPGIYDFGKESEDIVKTTHFEGHFDAYYFINSNSKYILCDYYDLTGQPIMMPEYSFYEAHFNAFNRDYWVQVHSDTPGAILYEDGNYYKCYKTNEMENKEGILESLNGENNNYQFSARAMVDRYEKHDMPLGWFIPNDGYGSGYGQTETLDGDINNLKMFAEYARKKNVDVALWTESNLAPKDPAHPIKGDRDLAKEVRVAGVVALKCDVAWIGEGYSFAFNAVRKARNIFLKETRNRPLILTVDGWAGTQRYAGVWSGDQSGGTWENIRFHIPTFIGSGLSGLPVIGSDVDGIFNGGSRDVNIRDYQWKSFTPLQLNMDGWGSIPKTPFSFDNEATTIIRAYLKMKSMLLPYNYTIGHESIYGMPMIRAMLLEFPEILLAYTKDSQYQYMWGQSLLVAPIYNDRSVEGNSIRDGIFLPDFNQVWIDFLTGEKYNGGNILMNMICPSWKIPIFVRDGAIIPMTEPNNNPGEVRRDNRIFTLYPNGKTSFTIYEDDGKSIDYLQGIYATTKLTSSGPKSNEEGNLSITINKTIIHLLYNINKQLSNNNNDCFATNTLISSSPELGASHPEYYSKNFEEENLPEHYKRRMKSDKITNELKTTFLYDGFIEERSTLLQIMTSKRPSTVSVSFNGKCVEMSEAENENIFNLNDNVYFFKEDFIINPYLKEIAGDCIKQKCLLIKIQKVDITSTEILINLEKYTNKSCVFGSGLLTNEILECGQLYHDPEEDTIPTSITLRWEPVQNIDYYEVERDGAIFTNITATTITLGDFKYESKHLFRIRTVKGNYVSKWSNFFAVTIAEDPNKINNTVVLEHCNVSCQHNGQEFCKLI